MALLGVSPAYAGYGQTVTVAGQVVVSASGAQPQNTIIQQTALLTSNGPQGAQLGPQASLLPYSPKITAVVNPTSAYKPTVVGNADQRVILLDFSGFPANLVSINLQTKIGSNSGGVLVFGNSYGVLMDFDQTNKFAYCGISNGASFLVWQSGMTLMYDATFIDSPFP